VQKLVSLDYIFVADSVWSSFNQVDAVGFKISHLQCNNAK